jgi:hypothetical protein
MGGVLWAPRTNPNQYARLITTDIDEASQLLVLWGASALGVFFAILLIV